MTYTFTEKQVEQLVRALDALMQNKLLDEEDLDAAKSLRGKLTRTLPRFGTRREKYEQVYPTFEEDKLLEKIEEALWRRT